MNILKLFSNRFIKSFSPFDVFVLGMGVRSRCTTNTKPRYQKFVRRWYVGHSPTRDIRIRSTSGRCTYQSYTISVLDSIHPVSRVAKTGVRHLFLHILLRRDFLRHDGHIFYSAVSRIHDAANQCCRAY